jgi:hypothetical protein
MARPESPFRLNVSEPLGLLHFNDAVPDGMTVFGAGIIAASGPNTAYRERVGATGRRWSMIRKSWRLFRRDHAAKQGLEHDRCI